VLPLCLSMPGTAVDLTPRSVVKEHQHGDRPLLHPAAHAGAISILCVLHT